MGTAAALSIHRFSTDHLPADARYQAWLVRNRPLREEVFVTEPSEPFNIRSESAQLGQIMFVYTEISAMRWERRAVDIRSSDYDPIIINMMVAGTAQGDMDGRAFFETAGSLHFHDIGRPSLHVSTASITFSIIIPRPVAQAHFGSLHDVHGLVIPAPQADLLFAHAEQTRRALPRLNQAQGDDLGAIFLTLAAMALNEGRPATAAPVTPESALLKRAEDEIDRRIGEGTISIAELCRILGVSRARLFRAFRSKGGIQNHIAAVRLDRSRVALADIDRSEPIGNVAHRFGFSDAPHLSRAFRNRYGMTPRDYRRMVALNRTDLGANLDSPSVP